jgi:hypothetical protein
VARNGWTEWRSFPDPRKSEMLLAPFGAGCYDIRRKRGSSQKALSVCCGLGSHVAQRMISLLPKPLGAGTRKNSKKRKYIKQHLSSIEYRTIACKNKHEAQPVERKLLNEGGYKYST